MPDKAIKKAVPNNKRIVPKIIDPYLKIFFILSPN